MAHRISRTDPSPSEGRILSRAALNARCALYLSTCCRSDLCSAYSARIQGWTYPGARYRHRSLCWTDAVLASRTGRSESHFDLVISNPPFGSRSVYDPNHRDLSKFSIHNYFIAKSLNTVREGGIV